MNERNKTSTFSESRTEENTESSTKTAETKIEMTSTETMIIAGVLCVFLIAFLVCIYTTFEQVFEIKNPEVIIETTRNISNENNHSSTNLVIKSETCNAENIEKYH